VKVKQQINLIDRLFASGYSAPFLQIFYVCIPEAP